MIHILILTLLLLSPLSLAQSPSTASESYHEKRVTLNKVRYIVVFDICSDCIVTIPLTSPLGQPHYRATIKIYTEIGDDKRFERTLFWGPFSGEWTRNGCHEDNPKSLVEWAIEEKAKPKEEQTR